MKETNTAGNEIAKKGDNQEDSTIAERKTDTLGLNRNSNNGSLNVNLDDQMKENGDGNLSSKDKSKVQGVKDVHETFENKNGNAKVDSPNIVSKVVVDSCESSVSQTLGNGAPQISKGVENIQRITKEVGESSHIKNIFSQSFTQSAGVKMNTPPDEFKRGEDDHPHEVLSSGEDSEVGSLDEDEYYDEEEEGDNDDQHNFVISSVQGAYGNNSMNHNSFRRDDMRGPDSTVAEFSKGIINSARENRGSPDSTAQTGAYSTSMREEGSGHPDSTVMQDYSRQQQRGAMLANNESNARNWGMQIQSSVTDSRAFAEHSNSTPVEEYVPSPINRNNPAFRNNERPFNPHNNVSSHYGVQIQQAHNSNSHLQEYVPSPVKTLNHQNYKSNINSNREDDVEDIESIDGDSEEESRGKINKEFARRINEHDNHLKQPGPKNLNANISEIGKGNNSLHAQDYERRVEKKSPEKAINWGQVSGYGEAFMKSISISPAKPKSKMKDDHLNDSDLDDHGLDSDVDDGSVSGTEYDPELNAYDALFLDKKINKNGKNIQQKQSVPRRDEYFDGNSDKDQNPNGNDDDDDEDIYGGLDSLPNLPPHINKNSKPGMSENGKMEGRIQSNAELDHYEPELEKHMGRNKDHLEDGSKENCANNSTVPATSSGRTSKGSMDSDRTVKYENDSASGGSSDEEEEAGEVASVDRSSDSTLPGVAPGTPWVTQRGGQGGSGEKEYACYKCGLSCDSKSVLAQHMKMHTRDDLFDSDDNRYHKRKRGHSDASSYQSDASFTPDRNSNFNKKRKQWEGSSPILPHDFFSPGAYMGSPQRKKLEFGHGTINEHTNKRSRESSSSPIDKEEYAKKHKLSPQAYKNRLSGLSPHGMKIYKKRIREGSTSPPPVEYDTTYNEAEHGSFYEIMEDNLPKKRLRLADENQIKQNAWLIEFKWLTLNKEKNVYTCEFCKLTNDENYVISEETSKLKRKDILDHGCEEGHLFAKAFAYASIKSVTLAQMRTLLLMCRQRIPLSNFPELLNLQLTNGCEVLRPFNEGILSNIQATPTELSQYMSLKFERQLTEALKTSSYGIYSIQADEAPFGDNASIIVVYVRYIDGTSGEVCTRFLRAWPAQSTSCEDVYQAIKEVRQEKIQEAVGNDMNLVGFATDGSSFMSGGRGGISRRLSNEIPNLISVNCLPHRLREISEKVANSVSYLVEYMAVLDLLCRTLRHTPNIFNSAVSQDELSETQAKHIYKVLAGPTRAPLSQVIQVLASYIPCVLKCVLASTPQQEHILEGQALLDELLQQMTTYQFIAITQFLADCMGVLQWLTITMQDKNTSLKQVIKAVHSTEEALGRLSTGGGPFSQELQVKFPVCPPESRITTYEGLQVRDTLEDREVVSEVQSSFVAELLYRISIAFPAKYEMEAFSIFEPREEQSDLKFNELLKHFNKSKWLNINKAQEEWLRIKTVIQNEKYKDSNMRDIYQQELHNNKDYPNVGQLCAIGLLLSVDSIECEKGMNKFANINSLDIDGTTIVPYIQSQMVLQTEAPDSSDFPFDETFQFWAQEKEGHEMPFQ